MRQLSGAKLIGPILLTMQFSLAAAQTSATPEATPMPESALSEWLWGIPLIIAVAACAWFVKRTAGPDPYRNL
jgi:hypothetical protein